MSVGRLEGKVAVITGGASGIGLASALRYAEEGAEVLISDLNTTRLENAAEEIRQTTNGRVSIFEANVCEEEQIEALMARAISDFGQIDTVLASAGVSNAQYISGEDNEALNNTIADIPLADWQRVLDINLTGVMLTDRHAARHMIAAGKGGSIVNIASTAARVALPGAVEYCVSKAGVAMLALGLGLELIEHKIRVNAIGPGFITTPMTNDIANQEEGMEMMLARTPMGRLGSPREMANTALYLACDESSYTTGTTVYPNGGLYIG